MAPIGPTTAVVVEARTAAGADSGVPQPGLLVYLLDSSLQTGYGPLQVLNATDGAGPQLLLATLPVGGELVYGGVTVRNGGASASGGAAITVTADVQSACSVYNCFPPAHCDANSVSCIN